MGFRVTELMKGTHELVEGGGPRPFELEVTWGPDRLGEWLDPTSERFLWQTLEGRVRADGLCGWTPCRGTLSLEYFGRRRIRYELDFTVAGPGGGRVHRFVGEKVDIRPWNLLVSHTTCTGTVVDLATGRLVSTAVVTFRLRHLPRMLLSTRWA